MDYIECMTASLQTLILHKSFWLEAEGFKGIREFLDSSLG